MSSLLCLFGVLFALTLLSPPHCGFVAHILSLVEAFSLPGLSAAVGGFYALGSTLLLYQRLVGITDPLVIQSGFLLCGILPFRSLLCFTGMRLLQES